MNRTLLILAGILALTAGATAQETTDNVDTVMLASDANFPDALVASGPAEKLGIPVLITGPEELPDETQQALDDLNPSEIEIIGGPAVVSEDLETQLGQEYDVTRHWGMTQVGTSTALAEAFWPTGAEEAVIVQYPLKGDAYWENGYKLLASLRGEVDERPVLLSKEGTLSSGTTEAAGDLNVSEATVYSTDAVNVTQDLNDVGVEDVEVTEGDLNELMQAIKDDEDETEDAMSQARPLVAVATGSYRDALAVSSSPDAASYLVSNENEIAGLIDRINNQNVSRVVVTGEPGLAATIADQVRSETDVDVKETSGNAAAASATNVRDSRAEWAKQQQQRVNSFREQVSSSAEFNKKVEGALNSLQAELEKTNRSELQEELDEAWTDYQNREYLDAYDTAQDIRSELRETRYEQVQGNKEAVRELVRSERESVSDLVKETGDMARDFSEDLREAETPTERRQIIKEFRNEREDLIQEHKDSIEDMLKDLPGRGPGAGDDDDMNESDGVAFTTERGDGELEIEAEDGEVTVDGEARVNTGGYTVETESSTGDGQVDVTFNLVSPENPATQALTTVTFSETVAVASGEHTVTSVVQVDGNEIFKHDETVMVSAEEDDEDANETEDEENEMEEQDNVNETEEEADVDREIDVEGGSYYFEPDGINVSVGDTVEFTLENEGGTHDLRIPTFGVGTEVTSGGEEASFTYTFEDEGSYEFLCSVGNHAERGMTGTINVNP